MIDRLQFPVCFRQSRRGFTLLEVLLAILIACGMLVLVLYFYEQTSNTRALIIAELETVSAARLLLDHISADLRCARPHTGLKIGFSGDTNSMEFLRTTFPDAPHWAPEAQTALAPAESDLHRIRYAFYQPGNTNLGMLLGRAEEPFYGTALQTNIEQLVASTVATNAPTPEFLPLTDRFHFVTFRYWGGTNWVDFWNAERLPTGVEITLAAGSPPEGTPTENYPFEIYKRIVFLPAGRAESPDRPILQSESLTNLSRVLPSRSPAPAPAISKPKGFHA